MSQINPALPNVGDDNWGTPLNSAIASVISESNSQDTRITTLESTTIGVPDATATTNGGLRLAGDLTGLAASPQLVTVVEAGTAGDSTHVPVLTWDAKGRITAVSSAVVSGGGGGSYSDEQAQDAIAAALAAGTQTGISFVYNDTANSISATVPPSYSDEQAQDAIATMFANGTQTGITFNYNDTSNSMSATVTGGSGGSSYSDTQAKAAAATALLNGSATGITYSYDSVNNVINSSVTSGGTTVDPFTPYGVVYLDSFAGSTDDAKLTNALSAVAADTYPRTIQLTNRSYTFATVRTPFTNMRIQGPAGYGNPERGSSGTPSSITLTMNGAWFTTSSTVYGVSLHQLSFVGSSSSTNASVLQTTGSGQFYCLSMRDIFAARMGSVLGTQATPLYIIAASFTGDWEINNSYTGAFHLKGSDNSLWTDGMLLDSSTSYNTSSNGQYHLWLDAMQKSYIGPVYITCEAGWGGLHVSGQSFNVQSSSSGGPLVFNGARIEGRNDAQPCYGPNVRQDGGILILRDCWVGYGLSAPSSFGTGDGLGVVHQTGGQLLVDGTTYDRADSVAETVPFIYTSSTGDCQVSHILRAFRGGTWTGRPRVQKYSGSSENRIADSTVTLI